MLSRCGKMQDKEEEGGKGEDEEKGREVGREASRGKGEGEAENEEKEIPRLKERFGLNLQPNVVHFRFYSLKYDVFSRYKCQQQVYFFYLLNHILVHASYMPLVSNLNLSVLP